MPELKDAEESIKNKINRDSRSESSKLVVAQRIKKQNSFKEYPAVLKEFIATVDTTYLNSLWTPSEANLKNTKTIMSIGDKVYTVADFAVYAKKIWVFILVSQCLFCSRIILNNSPMMKR